MNDLFELPESKSPRLKWLEKHKITVAYAKIQKKFIAMANNDNGWGDTEDEAITQLAMRLGIKLWNEEGTV